VSTSPVGHRPSALVCDVELAEPLPSIPAYDRAGRWIEQAWLLIRLFTEPLATVVLDVPPDGITPDTLAAVIGNALRRPTRPDGRRYRKEHPTNASQCDSSGPGVCVAAGGLIDLRIPPFLSRRSEVLRTAPPITVVICTRDRPKDLARCLDSLSEQVYPRMRLLVVDNAPTSDATERVVRAAAAGAVPVEYLRENRPGLSRARNTAVAACPGELLAWIDDDEVADPYWLAEVARALTDHPEADVVSGAVVPAELETAAQVWFEQFGGHNKGRGFRPAVFGPRSAHRQNPLYPLPPFGAGANMAFRPGVIERIGGFDTALGAGTPAQAAEDTLAFTQVLLNGGTIVYQPSAITRHYHRRDLDGLRHQMIGYGRGLTAAYTSLVLADPTVLWPLLRLVPTALRDVFTAGGARTESIRGDFPTEVLRANQWAMLSGPVAYLRGRAIDRRLSRQQT
jgi:GT2 family glycosyltransferase